LGDVPFRAVPFTVPANFVVTAVTFVVFTDVEFFFTAVVFVFFTVLFTAGVVTAVVPFTGDPVGLAEVTFAVAFVLGDDAPVHPADRTIPRTKTAIATTIPIFRAGPEIFLRERYPEFMLIHLWFTITQTSIYDRFTGSMYLWIIAFLRLLLLLPEMVQRVLIGGPRVENRGNFPHVRS
jgi:hypothetical protein